VIICDDHSQDGTFDFINRYIQKHSLINWKVLRNDINLGWINNFYKLFQLASSDIVFCADQDDVWSINKIELMTSVMENDNSVIVLGGEVIKFTALNNPIKTINIVEELASSCGYNKKAK
jgi:cellulose synthase/poly-beta-1,6-N-acetylglucosamine synthase-like glycosyltransferase